MCAMCHASDSLASYFNGIRTHRYIYEQYCVQDHHRSPMVFVATIAFSVVVTSYSTLKSKKGSEERAIDLENYAKKFFNLLSPYARLFHHIKWIAKDEPVTCDLMHYMWQGGFRLRRKLVHIQFCSMLWRHLLGIHAWPLHLNQWQFGVY